jgi:hypothetical protein
MPRVSCRSIEDGEFTITLYLTCDHKDHVGERETIRVRARNMYLAKSKSTRLGWRVTNRSAVCKRCFEDYCRKQPKPRESLPAIAGQPIRPFIRDPLPFVPLRVEPVAVGIQWTRKALEEDEDGSFVPNEIGFSPTHEPPGTDAKIEVLRQRAARGNPLFHVEDRKGYGDG